MNMGRASLISDGVLLNQACWMMAACFISSNAYMPCIHDNDCQYDGCNNSIYSNGRVVPFGCSEAYPTGSIFGCFRGGLEGGDGFLQIGTLTGDRWRIGVYDDAHFSISHETGTTAVIFRIDGLVISGEGYRRDFGLWDRSIESGTSNVLFGDHFVEFFSPNGLSWRLGEVDPSHLSLSHAKGFTPMIWRSDGTVHFSHTGHSMFGRSIETSSVAAGDGVIQIGGWRIGKFEYGHLAVWCTATGLTSAIYRFDSTSHYGARTDFQNRNPVKWPYYSTFCPERLCIPGYFREGGRGGGTSGQCYNCSAGMFSSVAGASACSSCGLGKYTSTSGMPHQIYFMWRCAGSILCE
jgi:hypothetical protein